MSLLCWPFVKKSFDSSDRKEGRNRLLPLSRPPIEMRSRPPSCSSISIHVRIIQWSSQTMAIFTFYVKIRWPLYRMPSLVNNMLCRGHPADERNGIFVPDCVQSLRNQTAAGMNEMVVRRDSNPWEWPHGACCYRLLPSLFKDAQLGRQKNHRLKIPLPTGQS